MEKYNSISFERSLEYSLIWSYNYKHIIERFEPKFNSFSNKTFIWSFAFGRRDFEGWSFMLNTMQCMLVFNLMVSTKFQMQQHKVKKLKSEWPNFFSNFVARSVKILVTLVEAQLLLRENKWELTKLGDDWSCFGHRLPNGARNHVETIKSRPFFIHGVVWFMVEFHCH